MASITEIAKAFFDACETGKGWDGCKAHCTPTATFHAQSDAVADIKTLHAYCDWMKGLMSLMPDGRYDVKAFATDAERQIVSAYGVFHGTHTGAGGPVPATGKKAKADYVYVMEFDGHKIKHMTKIWNDTWTRRELGWM